MSEQRQGRGCLKGCAFGCLGLVILCLGGAGIMGLLQFQASRVSADPVTDTQRHELPRRPATAGQMSDAVSAMELETTDPAEIAPSPRYGQPPTEGVGRLLIDFSMGELTVVPTDETSIQVEADYDRNRFRLEEIFDEGADGEWTYTVRLEPKRSFMGFTNSQNRVEIRVPRSHPLSVAGEVEMGESDIDLGGLWVRSVDLEMGKGQHALRFSEPTQAPLESVEIFGEMGEVKVQELGNASPTTAFFRHRMGQLTLDLEGSWRNDADVSARCRMGECAIAAPEGVRYETRGTKVFMGGTTGRTPSGEELPDDAPTLRLDLGATMGSVRIY